jgi:arsenate reductase (glutaredoxin)
VGADGFCRPSGCATAPSQSLRASAPDPKGIIPRNGKEEMKATIWHNPKCGTSRKTLEMLQESDVDVTVVEYLKNPPAKEELRRLYDSAGISAREGLRVKEKLAVDLGLIDVGVSEDAILDAMVENPILINRPLVETEKGARLCRPQERVREIL